MNIKLKTKLVKANFTLTQKKQEKSLIDYVMDELKGLDLSNLKLDPDFILYISEVIENQVKNKDDDAKPNKLDIFVEILKKLFPNISKEDLDNAKKILEFLLKNSMVKKTKLSKVMKYYLQKKFFCLE